MIINGDFMILNDGLCIEKNEKPKKKQFSDFSFWDLVNFKCEKSETRGQFFFFVDFDVHFFGYDSDDFKKKKFLLFTD